MEGEGVFADGGGDAGRRELASERWWRGSNKIATPTTNSAGTWQDGRAGDEDDSRAVMTAGAPWQCGQMDSPETNPLAIGHAEDGDAKTGRTGRGRARKRRRTAGAQGERATPARRRSLGGDAGAGCGAMAGVLCSCYASCGRSAASGRCPVHSCAGLGVGGFSSPSALAGISSYLEEQVNRDAPLAGPRDFVCCISTTVRSPAPQSRPPRPPRV